MFRYGQMWPPAASREFRAEAASSSIVLVHVLAKNSGGHTKSFSGIPCGAHSSQDDVPWRSDKDFKVARFYVADTYPSITLHFVF